MKQSLFITVVAALLASTIQAQSTAAGKQQFEAHCGGCHGADGAGGERGPNIVDVRRNRPRSKESLRQIIHNGIPGGGMPGFNLPDAEMETLVSFITSLTAPAIDQAVGGDARSGAVFFYGKGNCSECHMVGGEGGILGPDLSNLGRERRLSQIEQALHEPGKRSANSIAGAGAGATPSYQAIRVRLRDGQSFRGVAKNETIFDLQLQGLDGRMHLLDKRLIAEQVREEKPLMPAVQGTADELHNLLAYLSRLSTDAPSTNKPIIAKQNDRGLSFGQIVHPQPGEWPSYHGQLEGNRHSPLKDINTSNVAQLAPRWIYSIPNASRLQVTPLVVDGVMYVTAANEAYALDASTGRRIWHYARPLTKGVIGDAGGGINRGVAVLGEKVFMVTDHAHLLALHRTTGQLLWDVELANYREHYGTTSAPLVVNDLVITGTSGGDEGARGFIDAYKAATGEHAWRFWTMPAPGEPGSETWIGRAIEHGCTAPWLTGTYDAETNLLYWPTGNPCPDYNGDERKGDNLYSSSVVALDAPSGKLRWHYQFTPHDLHDWDAAQTPMLINADFRGRPRKLLAQANRNGFFYVLDRVTGEFLLGEPFVKNMTWASGIGTDGRPKLLPGNDPTPQGTKTCPSVEGATNWMSTAYHPANGLFYVMALEKCSVYTKSAAWWEPGKSFYGGGTKRVPGENPEKVLRALNLQTGKIAWEIPQIGSASSWGGILSTEGGVLFFGEDSGAFAAVDAKTGTPLWHFQTSQLWKASPMTYKAAGKQFVAVASGSNILAFGLP